MFFHVRTAALLSVSMNEHVLEIENANTGIYC